jgi:hypothetical protein
VNEPAAQVAHVRSFAGPPATLTNCPAAQSLHAAHAGALFTVLKEPVAHAEQTRSVTAEPALPTNCPVPHTVHGAQGLAGFASWSQVPVPQACGAAVAPAQYSPGLHGAHTGDEPALPGETCFVPAAHEPCGTH